MGNPSYVADPYVTSLTQLLEDIRQGFLLVPRFQRPFLWHVDRQIELLRSIRDGLPIGSIMVWRTRTQELPSYEHIGRHRIERPKLGPGSTRQYVLDGFQRLSTLYSALHQEDAPADDEDAEAGFYLDLDTMDFCTEPQEGTPAKRWLPMGILLQRMDLMRWERELPEERWIENAEAVFNAFDRCKIPVIPLVTEDLAVAAQAFERINTQGVPVGRLHVAHALSWSPDFDLLERVHTLKEEILAPIGWGEIEDDILLDTCALTLGVDLYEKNMARAIASKLRSQPDTLKVAVRSLEMAAEFLHTQGLSSPALVPYGRQIVLLAASLNPLHHWHRDIDQLLAAWLWLTTYAELFAGISGGRLQRVHEALQETARTGILVWPGWKPFSRRPLPARFDFRSARGKALAVRLAEVSPQQSGGEKVPWPGRTSAERLGDSLLQGAPRQRLSASRFACAGNRFLVPPEDAAAFRSRLLALPTALAPAERERRRDWLRSHVVSDAACASLDSDNLEAFVAQREADLNRLEEEFVARHLELLNQGAPSQ
ncbi:DUF262 domain-containing protein [Sorangium sp. So ce363]|uniref:DUF262 domain-containing protein n=1 Tax=Sorangium sp. So ce363 TaxID=3133304 RepID=UPI003F5D9707